ncbi:hypothetical protein HanPI659440_Chr04g0176871 [Helianthus annuus]|nr:hypothetical protein HanPI659440_Chr04g0176871 [Helianthus annuus]
MECFKEAEDFTFTWWCGPPVKSTRRFDFVIFLILPFFHGHSFLAKRFVMYDMLHLMSPMWSSKFLITLCLFYIFLTHELNQYEYMISAISYNICCANLSCLSFNIKEN